MREGVKERDVCKDRDIYISLCVFSNRIRERERERKREIERWKDGRIMS